MYTHELHVHIFPNPVTVTDGHNKLLGGEELSELWYIVTPPWVAPSYILYILMITTSF